MRALSEKSTKSIAHRMHMLLVSLTMLLVCSFTAAAQVNVSGIVQDEAGDPLPGVTVMVKGTTTGTSTDVNGQYTINAPANGSLTFTYVGMMPETVKIAGKTKLDVTMREDSQLLDEVVVVGYGQQKKITMTGSVVAVSAKDITKTTGTNVSQALVGKLPGMITQQSGGRPGADAVSILVRGYSSYNDSGTVLTIIDGVDRGSTGLFGLDPNDIESISVLKDAASCAVYGMKAANGVIVVTTKKGQEGKTNINYRGTATFNNATALPNMMNGTQYMEWYNRARELDGLDPYFTPEDIAATYNGDITDGIENTNWMSPFEKTTITQQHNLSISGGNERTHYFLSGGFMKQDGMLKGQDYQRGNFRSNVDTKIGKMFTVQFNVAGNVADSKYNSGQALIKNNVGGYDLENQMLYSAPYIPKVYMSSDPNDPYNGMPTSAFRNHGHNPEYAVGHSGFQNTRKVTINTSGRVDWEAPFLKGFKASFFFSWDWWNSYGKTFNYAYKIMAWNPGNKNYGNAPVWAPNLSEKGNMYVGDQKSQQTVIRPSISYTHTFAGKHNVDALLLYERTENKSTALDASRRDFPLFDHPYLSFGETIDPKAANHESAGHSASEGFAGRFSYNYDEKYLAEFAFRYDGSYLFAPGHRWGFFPSVSAGWVMSKEDWFRDIIGDNVNFFKLRGSIGTVGNDNVTAFLYSKLYDYTGMAMAFGSTPTSQGVLTASTNYQQFDLTWEKTRSYDIGVEMTMWNGLLGVEFDWFYKYTYDILTGVGSAYAPSLAGNFPSIDNTGRFDNRGFELVLRHTNRVGKVNYNITGNLSWAHNRILRQTQSAGVLPWQSVLGRSIGDVQGLRAIGLYQTEEQLKNMPKPIGQTPRLGDIMYEDVNGDGRITSDDYVKIGRGPRPEMMFALNADASWNGFDLSLQFQGAALCDRFLGWSGGSDLNPLCRLWYGNWDNSPLYLAEGSWRPDHTDAEYPRLSTVANTNNSYRSTFWKRNGAYLRLKNVTVGYTLPRSVVKKAGIENLRVFASGLNLFTITDFKYLDPESGSYVWSFYPQQRTFTVGLDLSF